MKIPAYVGLTGIQNEEDAELALVIAHTYGFRPGAAHMNMMGVLVSPSTMKNEEPVCTSRGYRHVPTREMAAKILLTVQDGGGLPMIHMELPKPANPYHRNAQNSARDAIELLQWIHGQTNIMPAIQLNGVLPAEDIVRVAKETQTGIVLQMNKKLTNMRRDTLLNYIEKAAPVIDTILFDSSAGEGKPIDVSEAVNLQQLLDSQFPEQFSYGYAGGFNGNNAANIMRTLATHLNTTDISVDIETGARIPVLHDETTDRLDLSLNGRYEQYLIGVRKGIDTAQLSR